jgi:hypothetical protein
MLVDALWCEGFSFLGYVPVEQDRDDDCCADSSLGPAVIVDNSQNGENRC